MKKNRNLAKQFGVKEYAENARKSEEACTQLTSFALLSHLGFRCTAMQTIYSYMCIVERLRLMLLLHENDAWMGSYRLKMNLGKTQMIWLGTRQQLAAHLVTRFACMTGTTVVPSTCVIYDCYFTMK